MMLGLFRIGLKMLTPKYAQSPRPSGAGAGPARQRRRPEAQRPAGSGALTGLAAQRVLLKLLGSIAYNGRRWGIYAGQLASAKPGNLAEPAGLRAGRGLSSLTHAASRSSRRRRESIAKPRPTKRAPRWRCALTGYPTAGRRVIWISFSGGKPPVPAFTGGLGIYRKRRMRYCAR